MIAETPALINWQTYGTVFCALQALTYLVRNVRTRRDPDGATADARMFETISQVWFAATVVIAFCGN